ncbi:flagellar hook-basal body complex protein FliE [Dethiothermospora halolimnae]|uniref:flagellar hook-basal body complex protein FliE n=1 Tax=Dethiothermospora halolimnae TaxID=3114390 RepID=UPI003CCC03D6
MKLSNVQLQNNLKLNDIESDLDKNNNGISFSKYFKDALDEVNTLQNQSKEAKINFALGKTENFHQVTIAAEKANIALQFTLGVRDKVLDAYKEIMRMQV